MAGREHREIWILPLDGGTGASRLAEIDSVVYWPTVSRDGRFRSPRTEIGTTP